MGENFKNIWIDWSFSPPHCFDMKWACKMKRADLCSFGINSKTRIKESKLIVCIYQKHQGTVFTS